MFFKRGNKSQSSYEVLFDSIVPVRRFDIDPEVESERLLTLKYVATEIDRRDVVGNVAEAGVMCGYFARHLHNAFPDRNLHLFDTFTGFNKDELNVDRAQFLTNKHDYSMFNNASIEKVKAVLPDAYYHVGLFNDTKYDVSDEIFCFVSLDMDLYTPTLQGLEFFYPRLSDGGYIFLHDYNHPDDFYGVKSAVYKYEEMYGSLHLVPLPDYSGTVVIIK